VDCFVFLKKNKKTGFSQPDSETTFVIFSSAKRQCFSRYYYTKFYTQWK